MRWGLRITKLNIMEVHLKIQFFEGSSGKKNIIWGIS